MPRRRGPGRTQQRANLDKRRLEPGTGLTPDKKEAHGDRGTGSDASAALAALDGGLELQLCSVTGPFEPGQQ